MKIAEGQLVVLALRAMYQHAEVVSGAYKLRQVERGVSKEDIGKYREAGLLIESSVGTGIAFRRMTDEEKLEDSLDIMQRHIELAQECLDHLNPESEIENE